MPIHEPEYKFSKPFAASGDKTIIGDVSSSEGRANLEEGFPILTQTPIQSGGVAPWRADFNGILYMLSAFSYWQQSGGLFEFSVNLEYAPPAFVIYQGAVYYCLGNCGPEVSVGVITPGTNEAYWKMLIDADGNISVGALGGNLNEALEDLDVPSKDDVQDMVDDALAVVDFVTDSEMDQAISEAMDDYVLKDGDTMTGPLVANGGVTGELTGNASTATALKTGRNITITVTASSSATTSGGSAEFNGTEDITIPISVRTSSRGCTGCGSGCTGSCSGGCDGTSAE